MKFKATLHTLEFDMNKWFRHLKEEMTERISKAAASYIVQMQEDVPKWSGASYITFLELANQIQFSLDVSPTGSSLDEYWKPIADARRREAASSSRGFLTIDPKRGVFTFTHSTTLKHFVYNEFNNANLAPDPGLKRRLLNPGPYHFQPKAVQAALADLDESVPMPNFIVRTIRVR